MKVNVMLYSYINVMALTKLEGGSLNNVKLLLEVDRKAINFILAKYIALSVSDVLNVMCTS